MREFLRYSLLNVLGMVGFSCYILADTYFISNGVGAEGMTALNLAIPVYSFVHGAGLMLGMGGGARYSILKGQKKKAEAERIFAHMMLPAAVLALLFLGCGILFSGDLARLLGADASVYAMTEIYIRVILFFSPAFLMNDCILCFVRNDGNPRCSMAAMLTGSLMNIFLDYLFVFPLGWGMLGAAAATGLAPVFSIMVLSLHFIKRRHMFPLMVQIRGSAIGKLLLIGVPSMIAEISSGVVIVVFNLLIMELSGNTGVAAYGVVANISLVVVAIYTGIAQGIQPLVSRYYGGGEGGRCKQILKYAAALVGIFSVLIYGLLVYNNRNVVAVFNRDGDIQLQQMGERGVILYFSGIFFAGMNIVTSAYLAAVEKVVSAQLISILRGFALIIPIAFLMSFVWGLTGVWLVFPLTELIVFFAAMVLTMREK